MGLVVVAVSSPPSSSLWKCGNPRLVRVSKLGGRATIFGQDSAIGPTERHFHSELGILPILVRMLSLAAAQDQNVRFQKPAQNEHFYRLSCRAFLFNPYGHGWHLDRGRFESLLTEKAIGSGVRRETRKRLVHCEGNGNSGFRLHLLAEDGRFETRDARFVVDATGTGSVFAQRMGSRRLFLDHLVFIYGLFEAPGDRAGIERHTVIEAVPDGWWYLAAVPGERIAVAFATGPELIPQRGLNVRDRWSALLLETALVARKLDRCRLITNHMIVRPAPTFLLRPAAGACWFAVGDAASAYDPISSQGIYKALSDGIDAADAVAKSMSSNRDHHEAYDSAQKGRFEVYLANRNFLYSLEQRWSNFPFWKARQARTVVTGGGTKPNLTKSAAIKG